jgi:hypothetical protein
LGFQGLRNQFSTFDSNFVGIKIQFEGFQVEFSEVIWKSLKMFWLHVVTDQDKIQFFEWFSWLMKFEENANLLLLLWQRQYQGNGQWF